MRIGAFTACLHDRTLKEALGVLGELGLDSAEINAGGFVPHPHLPVDVLMVSAAARDDYLTEYDKTGIALTALNVNGNPLHPDPEVSFKHAGDLRRAITLAGLLGVKRVVTMSGLPGAEPGSRYPHWVMVPWDSAQTEVREYQWKKVGLPFWRDIEARAADADVKVCIEMHPHMLVYNPATLERLVAETGATHVGAEMDPSHLFWQGIDPVAAVERLGSLVFHAAAKDTRINEAVSRVTGVLDDRFVAPDPATAISSGGRFVFNNWPADCAWQFVTVGRGHDLDFWARFLAALRKVDPNIAVNIEHEDLELATLDGLRLAAENLHKAASALPRPASGPA